MNVEIRENSDLLVQDDINVIVHQCNCFCDMGAGIARQIKNKFPEVYQADCDTTIGDRKKFGDFSHKIIETNLKDGGNKFKCFINLYSQYNFGCDKRYTNYEKMVNGLERLVDSLMSIKFQYPHIKKLTIGFPYLIGCGLAGGNWNIVRTIIEETFKSYEDHFNIVFCKFNG